MDTPLQLQIINTRQYDTTYYYVNLILAIGTCKETCNYSNCLHWANHKIEGNRQQAWSWGSDLKPVEGKLIVVATNATTFGVWANQFKLLSSGLLSDNFVIPLDCNSKSWSTLWLWFDDPTLPIKFLQQMYLDHFTAQVHFLLPYVLFFFNSMNKLIFL